MEMLFVLLPSFQINYCIFYQIWSKKSIINLELGEHMFEILVFRGNPVSLKHLHSPPKGPQTPFGGAGA
jgi:hypothetical protein